MSEEKKFPVIKGCAGIPDVEIFERMPEVEIPYEDLKFAYKSLLRNFATIIWVLHEGELRISDEVLVMHSQVPTDPEIIFTHDHTRRQSVVTVKPYQGHRSNG